MTDATAARDAIDAVEAQLGPIDVLVNSAGAARRYPPAELDATVVARRDGREVLQLHPSDGRRRQAHGGARPRCDRQHHRHGRQGRRVRCILPGGAANAALMLATVGLATAYAGRGVRVNGINPGQTLTDRVHEGLEAEARMIGKAIDELRRLAEARIPMGRMGTPEEVAQVVVVPRIRSCELCHGRDRADGRREQPGRVAMAYRDLRDFLAQLEQRGELKRVTRRGRSASRDDGAVRPRAEGRGARVAVRATERRLPRAVGRHDSRARKPLRHAATRRAGDGRGQRQLVREPSRSRQAARVPEGAGAAEEPQGCVAEHAARVHEGARHGAEGALERALPAGRLGRCGRGSCAPARADVLAGRCRTVDHLGTAR